MNIMKKGICVFLLAIATIITTTTFAHAFGLDALDQYEFYVTDENNSGSRDTFTVNETPYLYTSWLVSDLSKKSALLELAVWEQENGDTYYLDLDTLSKKEIQAAAKNGETYLSLLIPMSGSLELGNWNVTGIWSQVTAGNFGMASKTFSVVTPEPVSTILFTVGGLAFIARRKFMAK